MNDARRAALPSPPPSSVHDPHAVADAFLRYEREMAAGMELIRRGLSTWGAARDRFEQTLAWDIYLANRFPQERSSRVRPRR